MKTQKCEDCGNELFFPQRVITNGQMKTVCFHCCLSYVNRKKRPIVA
ncbi:hypothetical protein [Methanocella paludicola]|nr:hypothetical protein [Methanocella paludicola]